VETGLTKDALHGDAAGRCGAEAVECQSAFHPTHIGRGDALW
jgi:hypothetical protein